MTHHSRLLASILLFLCWAVIDVHAILGLGGGSKTKAIKSQILNLADSTKRGLTETPSEREEMRRLFEKLEKMNPNPNSLSFKGVNGDWKLRYTTSDSILGRKGPTILGDIVQKIDAVNLKAENSDTVGYLGGLLKISRKVTADLKPLSKSKVAVQFRKFTIAGININAPASAKGELDITYCDNDLRLSRGDKGNIFVLTK